MGLTTNRIEFNQQNIKDKDLILKMLQYEDSLFLSKEGQTILANYGNNTTSLEGSKIIQRKTLEHFGFYASDESVKNYRTIFHNYYKSAIDYDEEIINSVFYMRENRCIKYRTPELQIGDVLPDSKLMNLDGKTETSIYDILNIKYFKTCIIAAFSLS